jgi:hypothetical protein
VRETAVKEFEGCLARFVPEMPGEGPSSELNERARCDQSLDAGEILLYVRISLRMSQDDREPAEPELKQLRLKP